MLRRPMIYFLLMVLTMSVTASCSHQIAYDASYVPDEKPGYIAEGKLQIIMPAAQREFIYEGPPASRTGDFTTLIIPMGAIMRDVAEQVFGSCFAQGVGFAEERVAGGDYVVALEGDLEKFLYSYTEVIERGFFEDDPEIWIVPQVEMAFDVRAYDVNGSMMLEKTYESGTVSGEGYLVANRPHERINQTLHATLHSLILQVAADVRPLLVGKCEITELS